MYPDCRCLVLPVFVSGEPPMAPLAGLISFLSPLYLDQMSHFMDHPPDGGTILVFYFLVKTPQSQGLDDSALIPRIAYGAFLPLYI